MYVLYLTHMYLTHSMYVLYLTHSMYVLQLCPESQASLEVMAQLARWGEFSLLRCFIQDVKAVLAAEGRSIPVEFARQATEWRGMRCRVTRVSHTHILD